MQDHQKGVILIFLSTIMFGSYGVWSKLMGDTFDVFYQGGSRAVIIGIVLLPVLLYKKQFVSIDRKDWKWLSVYLIFTIFTQAPLYYAFTHMDIGSASLLFFTSFILTMYIIGVLFLGEKLTRVKFVSFVLACIGMYVVFSFSLVAFTILAVLMAIVNGIASGGEVASSKKLTGKYSSLYLTWLSWIAIVLTNIPISILLGETLLIPSLNIAWLYQLGYSAVSLFAFWFLIHGLKYVEASIGGLIGLLEIVFAILFGILLFDEQLTSKVVVGAVIILTAAALPHVSEMCEKRDISR